MPRLAGAVAVTAALSLAATGCSPAAQDSSDGGSSDGETTTVSVRVWDPQVQKAYDASFREFESQNPDIKVQTVLVPWGSNGDYFNKLRADVSAGNADDIIQLNANSYKEYADSDNLLEIGSDFDDERDGWVESSVEQYTYKDKLWGVPQLTDGGIAIYYNKQLVEDAGVDVENLEWKPGEDTDSLREAAKKLTKDSAGKTADEDGFDATKTAHWGYNASQDLQAIYYNYIGSNGGKFEDGDKFAFAEDKSAEAFQYIVNLINKDKVSPSAANTNDNPDFARDQFLQGKIAMFQSGLYNLKNVADGANFEWAVAPLPKGPEGAVSVTNSVIAAGNAKTPHKDATTKVLKWLGSEEGAKFIGEEGAALPAVTAAQSSFTDYWKSQDVDPSQFAKAAEGETIEAPSNPRFQAAQTAWKPTFNEIFLGRTEVKAGLEKAQNDANAAAGQ